MLLHFNPAQGLVRLALAKDLGGKQQRLVGHLANKAAAKWEGEQHPGWTCAGVDCEPLLADLQRIQVSTACSLSMLLALPTSSLCRHRLGLSSCDGSNVSKLFMSSVSLHV